MGGGLHTARGAENPEAALNGIQNLCFCQSAGLHVVLFLLQWLGLTPSMIGGPKVTEIGPLGAPKSTKIDRFGAPESTKMGRLGGPSLTKIGRLGAPTMTKIGRKWRTQRRWDIPTWGFEGGRGDSPLSPAGGGVKTWELANHNVGNWPRH